uniref:Calpain catalytic domain-containing protein n=1 Tax=Leptobrachium leishanense TaxID=445787 RepID=A0A8C5MS60_9ANUR
LVTMLVSPGILSQEALYIRHSSCLYPHHLIANPSSDIMSGIAAEIARDRAVAQGLGTPEKPLKYLNQDFEELKAQCLAAGVLFEDTTFPASSSSLGLKDWGAGSNNVKGIIWKRPFKGLYSNPPKFAGVTFQQPPRILKNRNCWFASSIASLTQCKAFLSIVVPENQSMKLDYAGIFHFKVCPT